jgi:hypothetical protein
MSYEVIKLSAVHQPTYRCHIMKQCSVSRLLLFEDNVGMYTAKDRNK